MKHLIFDASSRLCISLAEGSSPDFPAGSIAVDATAMEEGLDASSLLDFILADDNLTVVRDPVQVLYRVKELRKAAIKADAERMISATDWKLQRAQEREVAGWGTLEEVDSVLAERESIRQSSSAAEQVVDALTEIAAIRLMTWTVSVQVAPPRRLTQTNFMKRFSTAEAEGILEASKSNVALGLFWQKMLMASYINLDDPETRAGINALEIAGLLAPGRSDEILA